MKRALLIVAIVVVVVVGILLVRPLFQGDGNATFVSYAPGGKQMAYVTVDSITGIQPAHADESELVNGDRVKVEMGRDGLYDITGGPYR